MKEKLIDDEYDLIVSKNSEEKEDEKDNEEKNIKIEDNNEYVDSNKNLEEIIINNQKKKISVKIIFIYEIFISLFILINSFISFSFLNIIHILYSYSNIYNMYTIRFNFLITFEKFFSIVILIMDLLYLIFRGSLQLYMDSKKVEGNYDNDLFIYLNIYKNDWRTLYDYFMNGIIVIMIIIKLIFKNYNQNYFNDNELPENKKSIEKYMKNNSNILLVGIVILSFGSCFCPSIINLVILFFAFIYFCCRIFNRKLYKLTKKYLKYFFMFITILTTIYNYILSSGIIIEKLFKDNEIPFYYGITKIYTYENKKIFYNIPAIFNFILFYISFFFINLHTKCINYLSSSHFDRFNSTYSIENDLEYLKLNKLKKINNDVNNSKNKSLNETFIGDKEQIKIQSLFNFDMDCGIILFLKKSKNKNFFNIIKLFLLNFCYSTGFSLHACRLSFIFWINFFNVYYESYLIIIWLLFSIKFSETKIFFYFTKFIIFPFFIAIYFIYYVVNIIDQKIEKINVEPDKNITKRVINCLIRIVTIFLIQMFVHLYSIQLKNLTDKEIQSIINKHQRKIEKRIINEFKGMYVVKPIEIFFKLYFILIDILIIVFFYLSLSQKINFFNEIVLVCVIFFLIKGQSFKKYLYIFLIVLTFSFLLKYTIYLFNLNNKSTTFKNYANIIINDDLYKIYFYWISYYLLFLEFIGQNSKLFKLCESKNFSIYEIIEFNFTNYTYFKFILNTLFNFIFGVYIWLLIPCFVYCVLVFDNNCLSLFELTIVFIIYYKYIRIVNMKFKTLQNIFIFTRILIFTNIIYLIIEYILQFLNDSDFLIRIYLSYPNQKIIKVMELIGFFLFNSNYQNNLLSTFMMFILSLALHMEIHRQHDINTKDSSHKSDIEKYSLMNINKFSLLRTSSEISTKTDKSLRDINIENEEEEKQKKEKLQKLIKENQKMKKIVHKIFNLLYYILHYYWIIIFIFEVILSIHWMLSISMVIQLGIFSYYMAKSFNEYYKCLKSQDVEDKKGIKKYKSQTLNQKLKLYKQEQKQHFKITSQIQHNYFSLIWIFTFSFIVLSYLTSILQKILSLSEENEFINKYITAFTYFIGIYSESKNETNGYGFWYYTWGYFITIGLFSVRAYLLSKFTELKIHYFNDENSENYINELESKNIVRQSKVLEVELNEKVNKIEEETLNSSQDISFYENINKNSIEEENNNMLDENDKEENETNYLNINKNEFIINKKEEELEENFNIKFIAHYFKNEKVYPGNINSNYKDDFTIEYNKNIANKKLESRVGFQLSIKRLLEIIIIILFFINALIKCNVLSFIYLLIMIPAFKLNLINTYLMFRISFIALFLIILQYIFFISNISYTTNPFINKEIVLNINQIFHLPWYNDYRWSTFLSLGTNRYQIITIWLDVIIIIILYFYLEYFSFTIFIEEKKDFELKIISKKYYKKYCSLKSISEDEYKSFIRAMKVSYNIELIPSFETKRDKRINEYLYKPYNKTALKLLHLFKGDKRIFGLTNESKRNILNKIRDFLYISFQYLFLLITLLISSFNQGFIAFGYMAFSIYYIYKSNCFLKGRRWTLLNGIKYFMKPYLFLDILTQFIFQIPLDKFKKNERIFENFFKLFGYVKIADYSSQKDFISSVSCFIVILKILCAFLLLIQENMYNSFEFKKFILKYHYLYMQKTYIKGKLHSFLFNNQRVSLMNERNNENNKVKKNLLNIEKTVNIWNTNLKGYNYDDLYSGDNIYNIPKEQINIEKKQKGTSISKILREHWLISLTLKIFADSNHIDDEHYNISGYILRILKGNFILYSYLDNLISEYEKKNYTKYNEPEKLRKILKEYFMKKNKDLKETEEEENDDIEPLQTVKKQRTLSMFLPMSTNSKMRHRRISEEISKENRELYEALCNIQNEKNEDTIKENIEDNNSNSSESSEESNIEQENHESNKIPNNYIRFESHHNDMLLLNSDFRDLKRIIINNFFNECCSRKKVFLILLTSIWQFIIEHNEYSLYFFILLYHLFNGKLLSLIYPILILIFGIIQYPRPSKVFWKILMVYTTFVIFLKFLLQLNFWELDLNAKEIYRFFDETSEEYLYYLGLKKIQNHDFLKFMGFIFPDFFILILLIINQILLTRKGLWYNIETDYEKIEEANHRIMLYNSERMKRKLKFNENSDKILSSNEILKYIGKARTEKPLNIFQRIKKFLGKIFNRLRNEKPGIDYYNYYTSIQIIILIYIIFFYTKLEQDSIIYNANVFKLKQFSGNMVIFAFIHVFLLTFDRFLYLRNTGKLERVAFKVFNTKIGEDITYKFKKYKYDDVQRYIDVKNKNENNYAISLYQIEDIKIALIIKFILQVILVIFIHIFIYFYLPSKIRINATEENSEKTINNNKNVTSNVYISIFYLLYILYFFFSGLQIKYGFTDIKKISPHMRSTNLITYFTYLIYQNIPFLYELKNFIDWTFTTTALNLWQWLKLEEVLSLLYLNKCYSEYKMWRRVGSIYENYKKILMGGLYNLIIIALIFGPLILFSSLNPINVVNQVNGVNLKIILCMNVEQSAKINLTLFQTDNSIIQGFENELDYSNYLFKQGNTELNTYNKSYKYSQVQKVRLISFSEYKWDISNQFKNYFSPETNYSKGEYYLSLKYSFTTNQKNEIINNYRYEDRYMIDKNIMNKLSSIINSNESCHTDLYLENFYYPYQRITEDNSPNPIVLNTKKNVTLSLEKTRTLDKRKTENYNWYLKEGNYSNQQKEDENIEGIEFLTFTDLFSSVLFGYDVITFYITFIFVSGKIIRFMFLGGAEKIIYREMVNPKQLFSLCEGIKISRMKKNFLQEEKLYFLLIELMRSPEIIKNMTQSSLIYIQEDNLVKENKSGKFEVDSAPLIRKNINKRYI